MAINQALEKVINEAGGELVNWKDQTWEDDGTGDIAPSFPIIKVVQRMSTMEGGTRHVGAFWHSDRDGEEAFEDTLGIVPLVKRDTRAYFEEGTEKPICMSADGRAPLANQPLWNREEAPLAAQPTDCSFCPFSMWNEVTGKPPLCRESKVLLVVRDDQTMAQLRVSGMSIKPFEQYVAKSLKPKGMPLYSKRFVLTTKEQRREGKTWNEIEFYGEPLTMAEAQGYAAMLREQRAKFVQTLESEGVEWQDETAVPDDGRGLPFE